MTFMILYELTLKKLAVAFGKSNEVCTCPTLNSTPFSLTIGVVNVLEVDKCPVSNSFLHSLVIMFGDLGFIGHPLHKQSKGPLLCRLNLRIFLKLKIFFKKSVFGAIIIILRHFLQSLTRYEATNLTMHFCTMSWNAGGRFALA